MRSLLIFPFRLLSRVGIAGLQIIGLLIGFSLRVLRFAAGRSFSILIGAVIGLLLGRKHIGVKIFNRK